MKFVKAGWIALTYTQIGSNEYIYPCSHHHLTYSKLDQQSYTRFKMVSAQDIIDEISLLFVALL